MVESSQPERPDLLVSVSADCPDEAVSDLLGEAKAAGLTVFFERREPELFAAIEWLIPTAIVLFLGRKFIDTLAEEAAKDVYPAVKAAVLRVIRRSSGPRRALNPIYVSSSPFKVPPGPVPVLTIYVLGPHDLPLRFRFPADLPEELHSVALAKLAEVVQQPRSLPSYTLSSTDRPNKPLIFTFDSAETAWRQVDLIAEARERSKGRI